MSLVISKVFTYDTDAGNYIQAVEAADGQALEAATRQAINNFVVGCKQDGIWDAIKASCILAGARTLNGALVPLVGTAPTNFNFVSGDYNRKTGLVGNGSSKYLNSNRNNNADPLNNQHLSVYASQSQTIGTFVIGSSSAAPVASELYIAGGFFNGKIQSGTDFGSTPASTGFLAASRSASSSVIRRASNMSVGLNNNSTSRTALSSFVFCRNLDGNPSNYTNPRLAFYSIGESLDLALLDARVTALINAFGAAIP